MPRPKICRNIAHNPFVFYFKPRGIPLSKLEEVVLKRDELEAIRLCDLEGIKQSEAAKRMNISQPTLFRILDSARKKIADAIINGKAIRIE